MGRPDLNKLLNYKTTLAIARQMLRQGIITDEDYLKAKDMLAEKYGLPANSICR
jgi:hypothetical protein